MAPQTIPTRLLELLPGNSDPQSILTAGALTILFILASTFDMPLCIVSAIILIPTLPTTRLITSTVFCAARSVLLSIHSAFRDLWIAVACSSLSQAVARHLADATPVLALIVLTLLVCWSTLSSFCPCDVPEPTTPTSPHPPRGRSPMSFRPARGLPVLKLPSAETPTPCSERSRRYLEIIDARNVKIVRRAKRIEKLTLELKQAKQAMGVRDASIVDKGQSILEHTAALTDRDHTIAKNAEIILEKDAVIARLIEDVQHLRSDNADVLSTDGQKAAHISELHLELEAARWAEELCQATIGALHVRIAGLETDLTTARAEAIVSRGVASEKTSLSPDDAIAPRTEACSARHAAVVAQKDELIASLQADILTLQGELDSTHCCIVEKDALLAFQASMIDDLQSERDAATRLAQVQAQAIEELNGKLESYEQEASNRWLAEHHLPPADLDSESCDAKTNADVVSLTQQLAAAKREALDATRLQKAYEEVADAGAVRVIELVEKLEEQKESSEVDRELFLARIRKLTALLDMARSGIPVSDKVFTQLRLPTSTSSARAEDSFTAVTPRLPTSSESSSPFPSSSLTQSGRKLRRRSAIENLRQPLADVSADSASTANFAPVAVRQSMRRSRLPRPSSLSILDLQTPSAISSNTPLP